MLLELDASAILALLLGGTLGAAITVPIVRVIRRRQSVSQPTRGVSLATLFRQTVGGYDTRAVDDFLDDLTLLPPTEEGRTQALARIQAIRFPVATRHHGYLPTDVDAYLNAEARRLTIRPATPDADLYGRSPGLPPTDAAP